MLPASTKGGGQCIVTGPLDVCLVPAPPAPIPVPYANMIDGLAKAGNPVAQKAQKIMIDQTKQAGGNVKSATGAALFRQGVVATTKTHRSLTTDATGLKGKLADSNTARLMPAHATVMVVGDSGSTKVIVA